MVVARVLVVGFYGSLLRPLDMRRGVCKGWVMNASHITQQDEQSAYNLGVDAAKAAASWVLDGNASPEHYARLLQMIDDGDPELSDWLPVGPDLSGEWADNMTPARLIEDLGLDWDEIADADLDTLCDTWERGVDETFTQECERLLRSAVS